MRIIHFLNHTRFANGHVNVAVDLACEQARLGHEVYMMAGESDHSKALEHSGVRYISLPMQTHKWSSAFSVATISRLPRIAAFTYNTFARLKPDVVHSHMALAAVLAWTTRFRGRHRLVTTVHNSFDRQSILMAAADRVVCVSHAVANTMASRGVPRSKLSVVWNGTKGSARLCEATSVQPTKLDHPNLVCVAGLHPRKGVDDLIKAFTQLATRHPTLRLYIVGSGPSEADLKALAAASGFGDRIIVGSSRVDLQACKLEYSIVSPK